MQTESSTFRIGLARTSSGASIGGCMPKLIDVTNQVFARLTIINRAPNRYSYVEWHCRCKCGNAITVRGSHLLSGNTRSCGCLQKDSVSTHGRSRTPEWKAWHSMRQRCTNPNNKKFKNYGGRNIIVCKQWSRFERFLADMGNRPSSKHSLDRRDNNGNYEPSNCRWATSVQQNRNRQLQYRNRSGTIGITREFGKWRAAIGVNGKRIHLGLFTSLTAAVTARKQAELEHWD